MSTYERTSWAFAGMLLDGRLCTAARVLAGLSQTELAAEASLSVSVVARFEQGVSQPRTGTIRAIMDVLGAHGVEVMPESERHVGGLALIRGKWRGDTRR